MNLQTNKTLLGILVLALVFGMTVTSCGGDDEVNMLSLYGLSTTPPSTTVLTAVGLNQTQYNEILDAAGGSYKGWTAEGIGLAMFWTGRSKSQFDAVADTLDDIFDELMREEEEGIWMAAGYDYDIMFNPKKYSEMGFYLPAGTIQLLIGD